LSISHPQTPNVSRRLLAARAGDDARRSHGMARAREILAAHACSLLSHAVILLAVSTIARAEVIKSMTAAASQGDKIPPAQAATTACEALARSPAVSIAGRSNMTGRSRSAGNSRFKQKRSAAPSPAKALAMSIRVSSSAAASSTASSARVALLRAPLGRPLRLPPQG
jgi:hypothetical protein